MPSWEGLEMNAFIFFFFRKLFTTREERIFQIACICLTAYRRLQDEVFVTCQMSLLPSGTKCLHSHLKVHSALILFETIFVCLANTDKVIENSVFKNVGYSLLV